MRRSSWLSARRLRGPIAAALALGWVLWLERTNGDTTWDMRAEHSSEAACQAALVREQAAPAAARRGDPGARHTERLVCGRKPGADAPGGAGGGSGY